jgi:S-adenosylmethionine/arginine decarboxylase-like enzyme
LEKLFHQHLLIRAYVTNPIKDEEESNRWLTEVVEAVKMKVACPAKSKYVTEVGNEGITGSINLSTSHLAWHIWDNILPAKIELDLYSCAPFQLEVIVSKLSEMGLLKYHYMMIDRNSEEFKVLEQGTSCVGD